MYTARFLIHGICNHMRVLIHGCFPRFFRPSRTVKLYFSDPVVLYTVFSVPKTLVEKLVKNLFLGGANESQDPNRQITSVPR